MLLDEIGELSSSAQAALLRVIETKRVARVGSANEFPVDVRVLAATNRDLEQMCKAGQFRTRPLLSPQHPGAADPAAARAARGDPAALPSASCRRPASVNRCQVRRISPEAQRLLQTYGWPGNVRELRNVIERAVVIAQEETITADDLSERVRKAPAAAPAGGGAALEGEEPVGDIKDRLRRYEAELLLEALRQNDWNQTKTAAALNMPLRTLVHKMRTLGLRKRYDSKSSLRRSGQRQPDRSPVGRLAALRGDAEWPRPAPPRRRRSAGRPTSSASSASAGAASLGGPGLGSGWPARRAPARRGPPPRRSCPRPGAPPRQAVARLQGHAQVLAVSAELHDIRRGDAGLASRLCPRPEACTWSCAAALLSTMVSCQALAAGALQAKIVLADGLGRQLRRRLAARGCRPRRRARRPAPRARSHRPCAWPGGRSRSRRGPAA